MVMLAVSKSVVMPPGRLHTVVLTTVMLEKSWAHCVIGFAATPGPDAGGGTGAQPGCGQQLPVAASRLPLATEGERTVPSAPICSGGSMYG